MIMNIKTGFISCKIRFQLPILSNFAFKIFYSCKEIFSWKDR